MCVRVHQYWKDHILHLYLQIITVVEKQVRTSLEFWFVPSGLLLYHGSATWQRDEERCAVCVSKFNKG